MEEFEHMWSDAFKVRLVRILLVQLQIFHHELIHVMDATLIEKGWVLEDALTWHDAVAAGDL